MAAGHQWKHGWIPLTPAAALSKAKGNRQGAKKYLGKAKGNASAKRAAHSGHDVDPDVYEKLTGKPAPSREADARRIGADRRATTKALEAEAKGPFGKHAQAELDRRKAAGKPAHDVDPDVYEKLTGKPAPSREYGAQRAEDEARLSMAEINQMIKDKHVGTIHGHDANGKATSATGRVAGSTVVVDHEGKAWTKVTVVPTDRMVSSYKDNQHVHVRNPEFDPATVKANREAGDKRWERRNELQAKYRDKVSTGEYAFSKSESLLPHMSDSDLREYADNLRASKADLNSDGLRLLDKADAELGRRKAKGAMTR
jgi:hypothetical protein